MTRSRPSQLVWGVRLAIAAGTTGAACLLIPGSRTAGIILVALALAAAGLAAAAVVERGMADEEDEFLSGMDD